MVAPGAVEPVEVQAPPAGGKDEVGDAAVATRVLPDRSREDEVVLPPFLRDLVLMLQDPLGVFVAEIGIELLAGSPNHLLAVDGALALLQERDRLKVLHCGDAARGVLEERPAFLAHVAGEDGGLLETAQPPEILAVDLLIEIRVAQIRKQSGSKHPLYLLARRVLEDL